MRMAIVGKNPRASGAECIAFGHVGRLSHSFQPAPAGVGAVEGAEFCAYGDWEVRPMRPGASLASAPALVARSSHGGDYCRSSGRVALLSHSWSGVLRIDNIGRKYKVDLYSDVTRLVLVDAIYEIVVDVTPLARVDNGVLWLPPLSGETLVERIAAERLWFRPLETDPDYRPSLARRAIEAFRARPGAALRFKLMSALLPRLAAPAPAALAPPAPPPASDATRLSDEMRMLAAAVEGLALRTQA